jgi:ADP-heptose:LPS heptosyltransferase
VVDAFRRIIHKFNGNAEVFGETAALVSCLDLVTTVDISIAHLAGTMGCPTWIMLAHTPDRRWLTNRDDSPWYHSVRLFRQTTEGDYAGVINRIRAELDRLVKGAAKA